MLRHRDIEQLSTVLPKASMPKASAWKHLYGGYSLALVPGFACSIRAPRKLGNPEDSA